ncbi:TspO/MBR family protein [Companilactobacillus nuruki]|uniref:Sensory protein n=1 Tax=Companilactobacillus nuruki TaxID=1993540 RepID=A0A2N7AS99_9LACO|nr:TspO/MBR family protein [Companilactobacillus nuruki]PMD68222.1 sensory protein [Companilactobacillus nuruki]
MSKLFNKANLIKLIVFIIIVEGIGSISSLISGNISGKYMALNLPPLSPPSYLFGIVWPILYLLIATSGYLVTFSDKPFKYKLNPTLLFYFQLLLNFIWSIVFFNKLYLIGLIIIIVLDLIVILYIIESYQISKVASYLFIPYILWILFATYLTIGVTILN